MKLDMMYITIKSETHADIPLSSEKSLIRRGTDLSLLDIAKNHTP